MEIFKIILLIIAYTIGIISLTLQIICYLKEIEYKETIIFSVSFLLLISCIAILEFNLLTRSNADNILGDALYFFCLLLAFTTPLNIHRERIIKNLETKNTVITLLSIVIFTFFVLGFVFGFKELARDVILYFLYISITYSLILVTKTKPSMLVMHREKIEKIMNHYVLVFFLLYVIIGLLNSHFKYFPDSLFDGPIIISFIFIPIALDKLIDDLKRLTMFSTDNKYSPDKLSFYNITARESEVMSLLIKGFSYKEIAEKLFISLPTVKTHVSNIYQKMNIKNKVELINLVSDK